MSYAESVPATVPDHHAFACPRCSSDVTETWYGPCSACRADMRANVGGEQRDVSAAEYVPKMNVTPNAVATKE